MHRQIHLGEIDATGEIAKAIGRLQPRGPRHHKHVAHRRSGMKFDWSLQDHAVSPHRQLAHGQAWTRPGGWRLAQRALLAELDRLALVNAAHAAALVEADERTEGGCE